MIRTSVFVGLLSALLLIPYAPAQAADWLITREAHLYSRTDTDARILATLRRRTIVRVVDVTEQWIEIRSATGKSNGFIRRSYAEPFRGKQRRFKRGLFRLNDPAIVRGAPDLNAPRITTIRAGTNILVVDRNGNWYRVESERTDRPAGWIPVISAERIRDVR